MQNNITIGKIRGLSATSSPKEVFSILAFDHRGSFVEMINPHSPQSVPYEQIVEIKSSIVKVLAPHASAVLLDPVFSAAQTISNGSLPGNVGLLLAVDETGYTGEATARISKLLDGWSVAKIKRMGADAVKLLVYYHPDAGDIAHQQEQLISEVAQSCRMSDIPFFLEPVTYSINPNHPKKSSWFASQRTAIITETAQRLGHLGADVLKLEFPVDVDFETNEEKWAEACRMVSDVSPCPWTLLSAGVNYETFTRQVRVACKSGASGFIGGRAIWKEFFELNEQDRVMWLNNIAARRLDELSEIADEYARSWKNFFSDIHQASQENWYLTYEA